MNGVKPEDKRLTLLRSHELASQDSLWSSTLSLTPVSALDEPLASGGRSVSHRKLVTLDVYVLGKEGSSQLNYYLNVYLEDSLMVYYQSIHSIMHNFCLLTIFTSTFLYDCNHFPKFFLFFFFHREP